MDLYYIIIIVIVIFLTLKLAIKLIFGFWASQPIFHTYDIHYYFYSPQKIRKTLPNINKFCNFKNIKNTIYSDLSEVEKKDIIKLLQTNYLVEKNYKYIPDKNTVFNPLESTNHPCFVSQYMNSYVIDPSAILFIIGSTIDWKEDKFKRGFTFENPNETARCGCGESFSI